MMTPQDSGSSRPHRRTYHARPPRRPNRRPHGATGGSSFPPTPGGAAPHTPSHTPHTHGHGHVSHSGAPAHIGGSRHSGGARRFRPRRGGGGHPSRRPAPGSNLRPEHVVTGSADGGSENGQQNHYDVIPPLKEGDIRIIPLGGVEEIGRNMSLIEYGNDIVIVDCGFQFKEEDTPGIDFILPNTKYLEDRRDKIRGIFITHGHLDHIGGIPYIIDRLGYPPIYSRRLTIAMIKKRQEEFPHLKPLDIREVEKEETIRAGGLKVRFFAVTHTIPDSMGIIVETPHGSIVHTGDLKVEHEDGVPTEKEEKEFSIFKDMKVLALMADSTSVEKPGFSIPETTVHKNIEDIMREVKGRLIIATFASQLERIMKIIEIAERHGRKIVIEGRGMKNNIEIIKQLGILKPQKGTFIGVEEMESVPQGKILILSTGAQADEFSALMRMAGKTHRQVRIQPSDTIVLSSSVIPGNERAVQKLKDNLSRQGAKIIHYQIADVHSGGHAHRDETAWIHRKISPRFFIPLHGYHYMLRVHADIARSVGIKQENVILPDDASIIEIREGGEKIIKLKEKAPSNIRMVDGFAIGDIQEVVIRDRKMLSQDGMFVIIGIINTRTGKLKKSPDIISRGFVYLRESQQLLSETRLIIKKGIEDSTKGMNPINFDYVKNNVTDTVSRFLFERTNKRPIVIPVLLGV